MTAAQFINILVPITLIEMMMAIGVGVSLAELAAVARNWRLVTIHPDQVDVRADVYAVGAVGYFLLTATPVFTGDSVVEICMKHVNAAAESPSVRSGRAVSCDLERLLLRCLAKSPSDRPSDAGDLLNQLEACTFDGVWTERDAAAWWAARGETTRVAEKAAAMTAEYAPSPQRPAPDATMAFKGDTKYP